MPAKIVKVIKFEVESSTGTATDLTKYFKSAMLTDSLGVQTVYLPLTRWERFKRWIKRLVTS
jgi:hypothetical protein